MRDPRLPLSALVEPALLFDAEGALSATNDAAEALGAQRLAHAWRAVVDAARKDGVGRAVLADPERDGLFIATARRTSEGTTLLLLVQARDAVNLERQTFAANLIHELRNQAFAIDIHADELDDSESARSVRAIGQRLARLAQGLSDWIEPAVERREAYAFVAVVQEVCERLRVDYPSTALTVSGAPDVRAWGRRGRIFHALRLVLENAMLLSPSGTEVEVEVETTGDHLKLTARDRGPGLPRDAELRVWEPLYRRRKGGLGLGLAIARRFIADDGGRVRAENAASGGASITIEVPRSP